MEYLMTYGWAILIIAIVLVAFFSLNLFNPYTFAPKASPGSCQILRPNGPGSNIFVSEVGLCTTNEIPQYVAGFDGTSSVVSILNMQPIFYQNSVSYTGWIDVTGFNSSNGVQEWWSNNEGSNAIGLQSYPNQYPGATSTHVALFDKVDSNNECDINGISMNKWYFIVEIMNSTTATLNVSGQTCSFSPGNATVIQQSFTIGAYGPGAGGPGGDMFGYESNVQIYNTSLSSSQVSALYAEGIGGAPIDLQHLVGWWPLNGNSNDYSGNGNNGVPTGVTFTSSWENGYSTP